MTTDEQPWGRCITIGVLASALSAAVGALVAQLVGDESPVASVAGQVIDSVPNAVRHWAIETFGKSDKLVLGIGILAILAALGTILARVRVRRPAAVPAGIIAVMVLGIVAGKAPSASSFIAAAVSAFSAYVVFRLLPQRPQRIPEVAFSTTAHDPATALPQAEPMVRSRWASPVDRRQFVGRASAISAVAGAAAGTASFLGRQENESVVAARKSFPKVTPGTSAAAKVVSPGASVGSGASSFITPNSRFYRIDTAFVAPRVTLDSWKLDIGGAVERPLTLNYDQLLDRNIIERIITMSCVSNEVGDNLVGTAKFLGVRLSELLDEVGVKKSGTQIAMTSVDGWTCGFPTELAMDGRDAMVAVGMNDEPLPVAHGFPARVVVPGLYGYVSGTKWISSIELVGWDDFDGYWIPRGWSKKGPIKTQSRIDVPRTGQTLKSGRQPIAGIAFAPHTGIDRVEVRIDDGEWQDAKLGDEVTVDAWRQWVLEWDATTGEHDISVRATDRTGEVQPATIRPVAPDGATGHHTIRVSVG